MLGPNSGPLREALRLAWSCFDVLHLSINQWITASEMSMSLSAGFDTLARLKREPTTGISQELKLLQEASGPQMLSINGDGLMMCQKNCASYNKLAAVAVNSLS